MTKERRFGRIREVSQGVAGLAVSPLVHIALHVFYQFDSAALMNYDSSDDQDPSLRETIVFARNSGEQALQRTKQEIQKYRARQVARIRGKPYSPSS